MAYYFDTTVTLSFDEAVARAVLALKSEGFGVITDIDVQKTLREKIGVGFRKYRILGACDPSLAYDALQFGRQDRHNAEDRVEVAAIDPVASMQAYRQSQAQRSSGSGRGEIKKGHSRTARLGASKACQQLGR